MTQPPFSLRISNSRTISSLRYLEKSLVNCLRTLSSKNAYLCNPNILRNLLWWFLTQSAVECIKLGHSEVWFFTYLLDLTRLIWQFKGTFFTIDKFCCHVTKIVPTYCDKNCSSDWEELLKFEAEGREFAKFLRSLEQFIQTVKVQNNFW